MFVGLTNSEQFGPFYTYLLSLLLCIIPLFAETALGFVVPVGVMEQCDNWNFKGMTVGRKPVPAPLCLPGQLHMVLGDSITAASTRAALNLRGLCSHECSKPV